MKKMSLRPSICPATRTSCSSEPSEAAVTDSIPFVMFVARPFTISKTALLFIPRPPPFFVTRPLMISST
jgi:hypothetical protein